MSNGWHSPTPNLMPGDLARAEDMNDKFGAVDAAFDKLPEPHPTSKGFVGPIMVGDGAEPGQAINKGQLDLSVAALQAQIEALAAMISGGSVPEVSFTSGLLTVNEADGVAILTLSRTLTAATAVRVETVDGDAVADEHYSAVSEVVAWAEGDTGNKTVEVPILLSDSAYPVQFSASLVEPINANIGVGEVVVTIEGDDPDPPSTSIYFAPTSYVVSDTDGAMDATAYRGVETVAASATVSTADGTARAGQEYLPIPGGTVLEWGEGFTGARNAHVIVVSRDFLTLKFDDPTEANHSIVSDESRISSAILGAGRNSFSGAHVSSVLPTSPIFGKIYFEVSAFGDGLVFDARRINADLQVSVGASVLHLQIASGLSPTPYSGTKLVVYGDTIGGIVLEESMSYVHPVIGVAIDLDDGSARIGVEIDTGGGLAMQWLVFVEGFDDYLFTEDFNAATAFPVEANKAAAFSFSLTQDVGDFSDNISFEVFNSEADLAYLPAGYSPWRSSTVYPADFSIHLTDPVGAPLGDAVATVQIQSAP